MLNPLKKAIDEIKYRIPKEILEVVFLQRQWRSHAVPPTIDEQLEALVLRPRLMVDCDLLGGVEVFIPTDGLEQTSIDPITTVYFIPKNLTQGRSILSVLGMSYAGPSLTGALQSFKPCSITPAMQSMESMMNTFMPVPAMSTAKCSLVGDNTVRVREQYPSMGVGFLRCIIANDENLANLQLKSILTFADGAVLCSKAYIYNDYTISLDRGQIMAGHDIGKFKDIVDAYADAEELYREWLRNKWQKVSFFNDYERRYRFIKMLAGGQR